MTTTRKRPQTKTQKLAAERLGLLLHLQAMSYDREFLDIARIEIPEAWHTLEMDVPTQAPKEKVTLYLDRAVAQMFRRMGKGYQARINRILETWMQMKMADYEAFKKSVMERATDAIGEKDAEWDGFGMQEHYAALMQDWAFLEGMRVGKMQGGEG